MSTPYYVDEYVTLYYGDYRDILPALGVFDCVVTDPPYGDTSLRWDRSPAKGWLQNIRPHLAPTGSVWFFASLKYALKLAPEIEGSWKVVQDVIWGKQNGSNFHNDRFRRVHENAIQVYPADVLWGAVYKSPVRTPDSVAKSVLRNKRRPSHTGHIDEVPYISQDGGPRLQRSIIEVANCHGYAVHPTQKPNGIVAPLIEYSCPVGGIVLDIFAGSGTTLEVCRAMGRNAVGIENNERYCELAAKRLSESARVDAA